VTELVANDGFFTQGAETAPKPRRSMVKRGALMGATVMFIGSLLFSLLFILPEVHGEGPREKLLRALFFYWVALMTFVGASGYLKRLITNIFNIFSEEEPSPSKKVAYTLPAAYIAPVVDKGRQFVNTANAPQPSSVAEQTTSRLNNA
jgi:hypothetical protein